MVAVFIVMTSFFVDSVYAKKIKISVEDCGDYILFSSSAVKNGVYIIYCHGAFGTTSKNYLECKILAARGYNVAAVKYSNAKSLENDLIAVRKVREQITGDKVFIMGISRGGFLALQIFLSDNDFYDGAIIVAAPTSVSNWKIDYLSEERKNYFTSGIDALENYYLIKKPVFLLYGDNDTAVPASQGKMLWEKNPDLFEFKTLSGSFGLMNIEFSLCVEAVVVTGTSGEFNVLTEKASILLPLYTAFATATCGLSVARPSSAIFFQYLLLSILVSTS